MSRARFPTVQRSRRICRVSGQIGGAHAERQSLRMVAYNKCIYEQIKQQKWNNHLKDPGSLPALSDFTWSKASWNQFFPTRSLYPRLNLFSDSCRLFMLLLPNIFDDCNSLCMTVKPGFPGTHTLDPKCCCSPFNGHQKATTSRWSSLVPITAWLPVCLGTILLFLKHWMNVYTPSQSPTSADQPKK